MFNFVMNTVEKMFPVQLDTYLKNHVDRNRHETQEGIEVWNGKFVDKKIYTFEKSNYIKALGYKFLFEDGVEVYGCEYGERNYLMSAVEMAGRLTECIKWENGRSETAKNMMIGDHKIRANITYETFTQKREELINEIVDALIEERKIDIKENQED